MFVKSYILRCLCWIAGTSRPLAVIFGQIAPKLYTKKKRSHFQNIIGRMNIWCTKIYSLISFHQFLYFGMGILKFCLKFLIYCHALAKYEKKRIFGIRTTGENSHFQNAKGRKIMNCTMILFFKKRLNCLIFPQ